MRRAGYESGFLLTKDGDILGVSLHGDMCSEHEVGIKDLKGALGTAETFEHGLVDRVNTRLPPAFQFETYTLPDGTPAAWLMGGDLRYARELAAILPGQIKKFPPLLHQEAHFIDRSSVLGPPTPEKIKQAQARTHFAGAWDSAGFLIHVRQLDNVNHLRALADAFTQNDIAFGGALLKNDPDQNEKIGGLTFVRASKISPEAAAAVLFEDQRKVRLALAADQVLPELKKELLAANKRWHALLPRWIDRTDESKGVEFYLSPQEQSKYSSGAYTVEQLRAWAKEEGPILRDLPLEAQAKRHEKQLSVFSRQLEKANIQVPHFHTVRTRQHDLPFAIDVSYRFADGLRRNQTRLSEGQYALVDLLKLAPEPAPCEPAPARRVKKRAR
jgi:hypothetical protein